MTTPLKIHQQGNPYKSLRMKLQNRQERSLEEQNLTSLREHVKKAKQYLRKAIKENRSNDFIQEKEQIIADFESLLNIAESGSSSVSSAVDSDGLLSKETSSSTFPGAVDSHGVQQY
jgi:hypothetical protein